MNSVPLPFTEIWSGKCLGSQATTWHHHWGWWWGESKRKKKKKKSQARLLICSTPRCQQDGTLFLPPNLWWRAEWISGQPVSCKSLQGLATQLLALLLLKARLQNWEKNSWSYQTAGGGAVAGLTAQNAEILRPFLWRQQQSRNIAQGAF